MCHDVDDLGPLMEANAVLRGGSGEAMNKLENAFCLGPERELVFEIVIDGDFRKYATGVTTCHH
jgi:hypothetical protein